ncbi:MAG: hypothetical protein ACPL1F_04710 [bacterium]
MYQKNLKNIFNFMKAFRRKYFYTDTDVLVKLPETNKFYIGNQHFLIEFQDEDLEKKIEEGLYDLNEDFKNNYFEIDIDSRDKNWYFYNQVKEILSSEFKIIELGSYTDDIEYIFLVAVLVGLNTGHYLEYKFLNLLSKLMEKEPFIRKFKSIGFSNGYFLLESYFSKIYVGGWQKKDNEKIKEVINNLKEG